MAGTSLKEFSKLAEDKIKLALVLLQKFINERNPREKQLIIVLGIIGIIFLDYWLLIRPVVDIFVHDFAQADTFRKELQDLKNDKTNRALIEKSSNQTKEKLVDFERCFVTSNEMPAFLENISKLALDSGVKVISLNPQESLKKASTKKEAASPYTGMAIRMSAVGGTHEFGKFLSWLETNPTFMKVTDIRISPNSMDDRKHILELSIEVYRKEALS